MTKIKFHLAEQPRSGLHWSDVKHEITAWWHSAGPDTISAPMNALSASTNSPSLSDSSRRRACL
jgi:hypothetical protein